MLLRENLITDMQRRMRTHPKICFYFKKPQFLSNHYETLSNILTKFSKDWVKIVDF